MKNVFTVISILLIFAILSSCANTKQKKEELIEHISNQESQLLLLNDEIIMIKEEKIGLEEIYNELISEKKLLESKNSEYYDDIKNQKNRIEEPDLKLHFTDFQTAYRNILSRNESLDCKEFLENSPINIKDDNGLREIYYLEGNENTENYIKADIKLDEDKTYNIKEINLFYMGSIYSKKFEDYTKLITAAVYTSKEMLYWWGDDVLFDLVDQTLIEGECLRYNIILEINNNESQGELIIKDIDIYEGILD